MAQCDVQTLMREAKCFECLTPGMWQALELALLCDLIEKIQTLADNSGQEVFPGHYGAAPPEFVPPLNRGVANDLDAPFVMWSWDPDSQSWK